MKRSISFILALIFSIFITSSLFAQGKVMINSLGYQPASVKVATITAPCSKVLVKAADGDQTLLVAEVIGPFSQTDVGQKVWKADFSALQEPGKYYIDIDGVGRSQVVEIGQSVYRFAYTTSMRAFYLWRCGMAVEGHFNGNHYATKACHLEDGWLDYVGQPGERRDGTGGWHDAGDHGKYTVNAGVTLGLLFYAWDHFGDKLKKVDLEIPETTPGMPDFLQELKWETDYILKMQYADGSGKVSHKLTRVNFEGFIMPQHDGGKRYFTDWSSDAVAEFVAMMAMGARYFQPYDAAYAKKCLDAAKVSFQFLLDNPEQKRFQQGVFKTGGYQSGDKDDRLWAAAEMWETTGDAKALAELEKQIRQVGARCDFDWDWSDVANLGMFTYALSKREGRDTELLKAVKANIISTADSIVLKGNSDVYGRPLGGRYYWGCNGTVARQALNVQVANKLSPDLKYLVANQQIVDHLFGRNYYGRSYVTGLGANPPMNPHDRRSGADGITDPWPGYLVGGGHKATDWVDKQESYSHNEIAINWQAALVYALAPFLD